MSRCHKMDFLLLVLEKRHVYYDSKKNKTSHLQEFDKFLSAKLPETREWFDTGDTDQKRKKIAEVIEEF